MTTMVRDPWSVPYSPRVARRPGVVMEKPTDYLPFSPADVALRRQSIALLPAVTRQPVATPQVATAANPNATPITAVPSAGSWSTAGLTDTEAAIKNRLMGQLGTGYGSLKDALFGSVTRRLNEDYQNRMADIDRDLIRRGFGLNSGEALNQMNLLNRGRNEAITEAARQAEMYGAQAENALMGQLGAFGAAERANEQAARDREYAQWLQEQEAIQNAITQAMGFAGLNSGLAGQGYAGYQNALAAQNQAYGNLGAWGMQQLQPYLKEGLFSPSGVGATLNSWGRQPNDEIAYMGTW